MTLCDAALLILPVNALLGGYSGSLSPTSVHCAGKQGNSLRQNPPPLRHCNCPVASTTYNYIVPLPGPSHFQRVLTWRNLAPVSSARCLVRRGPGFPFGFPDTFETLFFGRPAGGFAWSFSFSYASTFSSFRLVNTSS